MNIAIVDDSYEDRVQLMELLKKYMQENSVLIRILIYENGEMFLNKANFSELDAVFLDIYMENITGMEVAEKLRKVGSKCKIIFTTTTSSFALQSYDVRAFDYIVKPLSSLRIDAVIKLLEESNDFSFRFISVKEGREIQKVVLSDIIYIDYHNHYIQIHTNNGIISTYKKFSEMENELLKYKSFLTCYRCVIVNMDQIEKIRESFFLMKNGEYIPINRSRSKEIKMQYFDYVFGEMEGCDYAR